MTKILEPEDRLGWRGKTRQVMDVVIKKAMGGGPVLVSLELFCLDGWLILSLPKGTKLYRTKYTQPRRNLNKICGLHQCQHPGCNMLPVEQLEENEKQTQAVLKY